MSIPRVFIRSVIPCVLLFGLSATADLHNRAAADESPQQTNAADDGAAQRSAEPPNALVLHKVLKGHQTDVRCLAFSPDGKILASGGYGQPTDDGDYLGYVKFWDVASGKETKSLAAHSNSVLGLAFTPDGKQLVTGGADEKIRLWNLGDYKYVKTFSGHTDAVYGVAVSPSGKSIASASYDDTVRVWDIESGKERFNLDAHTDDVTAVAFSPDSKTLASVSHDETVRLWGPKTGTLKGHDWWVVSVRFSPDGKLLATGSWDDTAILWDVAKQEKVAVLDAETSQGAYVAFTPDGRTLITAGPGVGTSAIIKIWDVETQQARATIDPGDGLIWAIDVSPDGKYLATGSGELIKLWELTTQRPEDLPPLKLDKSQIFGFSDDRLEIKNDYLTQQGGIHPDLIKAVKDAEGVTRISVMNTRITDAGFAQLAELPWVGRVETLNLMSTRITDASLMTLSKFPALTELYLSGCEKFTDDGLAALEGLDELANLQLGGTRIGDAGLAHVGKLESLEQLGLASSKVTDAGLPQLAGLKQLRLLNLSYCRISDAGLKPLAGLSALESLELNDGYALNERVSNITGSGLRHLAKLSKLRMLDLDHTKVNDEGLSHLAPLSQLESLSLHGTKISDAAAKHFGRFKNLETLDVEDTQVGDEVMKAVSQLGKLEDLTIEETQVTDTGLAHLAQLKNLKSLWLEDSKVTYEGVQRLRKTLPELDVEGAPRPVMQEHLVEADPLAELDFATEYHQIHALAYSPDGKLLAAGGETGFGEDVHGAVKLWDAKSKKLLDWFELGHAVYWLSFSEDGGLLVASGKEGETGKVWFRDVAAKKVTHTLEHGKSVRRAELLPEGKICFTAALLSEPPLSDSDVKLWDWQAGKETADFEDASHDSTVSPDGKLLATTARFASTVELIDLKTKEKAAAFEYAKDPDIVEADYLSINTTPLMFRADGKQIALGISEPISELSYAPVKTWNVETGEKGPTLKQYAVLQSVAYSPDGSRIATSGHLSEIGAAPRGRAKLFDAKSGDVLCTIERRLSLVSCVRFSPDGKQLAAAFNDKVRVWEIDKLLAAAKE
jgi:WD40 repeat protein